MCDEINLDYKLFDQAKRVPRKLKKKIHLNKRYFMSMNWDLGRCVWYKYI